MLAGLFGPLVIVPVVVCVMSVSLTSYPQLHRYHPVVIAILATSWLVPALLLPVGTLACIGTTLAIVAIGVFTSALSRSRHAGLQQVERQAWVLGQLLPQSHPASSSGVW